MKNIIENFFQMPYKVLFSKNLGNDEKLQKAMAERRSLENLAVGSLNKTFFENLQRTNFILKRSSKNISLI